MGKVSFARVDERLIHGQVVVTIASSTDANTIYIVDDELAKDDFMQTILEGSARKANMEFKALSVDDAVEQWEEDEFGDDKVLLITKTAPPMIELGKRGVPLNEVNLGNIAKKNDAVQVINSAAITEDEFNDLKQIAEDQDANVYFQTVPGSTNKVSLDKAEKNFN